MNFDRLSAAQREAVDSALTAAFGRTPIDNVTLVSGGASGALPFRFVVRGRPYLIRVEGDPSPLRNPHQYVAMCVAAAAGIAPQIHHIDEGTRIAVMDFVMAQPLETFPGGAIGLARGLGQMLGRVQATAPFPRFVEYPDIVARLWAHVCRSGLFAPGVLDVFTDHLAHIREHYVWGPENSVSSHNDPVPSNILFDGKRLWLIDWESAYRNDPVADVAIMLDNLAASPELERILLQAWLGRSLDDAMSVRLNLMRALTRLYYAGVLLSASASAPRTTSEHDPSAFTLAQFQIAIRDGRLVPGTIATKHALGKMYLASFLANTAPPGLTHATAG